MAAKLDRIRINAFAVLTLELVLTIMFFFSGNTIGVYVAAAIGVTTGILTVITHRLFIKKAKEEGISIDE